MFEFIMLVSIAPTTILHLPGASQEAFGKMSLLSRSVPVHILEAGTDPGQIPQGVAIAIDALEDAVDRVRLRQ